MTGPTPLHRSERAPQMIAWLTLAVRAQLERDLSDLPELADMLARHYPELLAAGDRDPDDRSVRYPIKAEVLDLADERRKPTPDFDPIGEADLARRIGARRQGVLPCLIDWARLAESEMLDLGVQHGDLADDPSVTTEAGWIARHLDWIGGQQWVVELAQDVRAMVTDLEIIVGPVRAMPDDRMAMTARELADHLDVSYEAVRQWVSRGYLAPLPTKSAQGYQLYARVDGENVRRSVRRKPASL